MIDIIAVDFDGTLNLENVYPDMGKPNTALIQRRRPDRSTR